MGKRTKKQGKREKLEIVFDPKSRKEFLTGFRKRKNERKKRAKEDLERLLKEERKRIRQEVKDGIKHLKKSYEPLPDIEDLLNEKYEDESVTVKVVELSTSDIAKKQNYLGDNSNNFEAKKETLASDSNTDEEEEIPGMSVTAKKKEPHVKEENDVKDPVTTKKDIDKIKQKRTLKSMQKSKFFKMKQQFEKLDNKKKARKERNKQVREFKKKGMKFPKGKGAKRNFKANKRRKS